MPRNPTTGDFVRVSNTFSEPVYGTVIDPTDANSLFDDYDVGLTFDDASPLILIGSTSGVTTIKAADAASGTITLPAGTTDFSATGGTGQFVRQDSAGAPFTVTTVPASAIASGAALTRVDDTNVTLTLGGSPSTALLAAASITAGWSGQLAISRGGLGLSSFTQYNLVIGNGTSAPTLLAPSATSGVPLVSQGASANPAFGTAVVAGGGTGNTTFTAYSVICAGTTATGAFQNVVGVGTSGQVLTSAGAGALPSWTSVGGTGTVTSVAAGTGMSFSTITTTGSVAIDKATDANIRAATSNKVVTADLLESAAAVVALTDAAPVAIDWDSGINFSVTVTADRQIGNPTNGQPGTWRTIMVQGNNGTDRTITFGNQYLGDVPTITDCDDTKWYLLTIYCYTTTHFVVSAKVAKS